jgi:hypothetical protein
MIQLRIVKPAPRRIATPQNEQPRIGVIASIVAGFEAVNARLWLVLLPLALDLFLWLGPQLSIRPLIEAASADVIASFGVAPEGSLGAVLADQARAMSADVDRYDRNQFQAISTAPLGIPSMMGQRLIAEVPYGAPWVLTIDNGLVFLAALFVLLMAGLFLGALYFEGIGQVIRDGRIGISDYVVRVWLVWVQLFALGLIGFVILLTLMVPVIGLVFVLGLLSPLLAQIALTLGFSLVLWVVAFLGFSLHAITLGRKHLLAAMLDSLRLVRHNLAAVAGLWLAVMLLYFGLGFVWSLAPSESWVTAVAIIAHGLVATALVAATYVFYQDRSRRVPQAQTGLARPRGR